jgi:hypothetical protein
MTDQPTIPRILRTAIERRIRRELTKRFAS